MPRIRAIAARPRTVGAKAATRPPLVRGSQAPRSTQRPYFINAPARPEMARPVRCCFER
jgi:hypothetical protein